MEVEISFNLEGKRHVIKCSTSEYLKDVCEKFATENSLEFKDLVFICNNQKLNFELNLFVEEQFELGNEKYKKSKKKLEINVYNQPFFIKFLAFNKTINLPVKEEEKMKDVFERYAEKAKVNLKRVFFLYNSQNYLYEKIGDLTVFDMANQRDKEVKVMSVTVNKLETTSSMEGGILLNKIILKTQMTMMILKLMQKNVFFIQAFL